MIGMPSLKAHWICLPNAEALMPITVNFDCSIKAYHLNRRRVVTTMLSQSQATSMVVVGLMSAGR